MSKMLFLYFRKHFCLIWTVEEIQQSNQIWQQQVTKIRYPLLLLSGFNVTQIQSGDVLLCCEHLQIYSWWYLNIFSLYFRKHIAQMWTAAYSHQIWQGILTGYWIWWPYCMCATAALFIFLLHYGIFSAPFRCWMPSVWLRLVVRASEQKSDSNS